MHVTTASTAQSWEVLSSAMVINHVAPLGIRGRLKLSFCLLPGSEFRQIRTSGHKRSNLTRSTGISVLTTGTHQGKKFLISRSIDCSTLPGLQVRVITRTNFRWISPGRYVWEQRMLWKNKLQHSLWCARVLVRVLYG